MRLRSPVLVLMLAAALAGCNDTLDSFDPSKISNKVEQPLPQRILTDMKAKGMERQSPIMVRVFKEEGVLEIWKAKTNGRFDKIAEYEICAWSGRLGPKVKEGDRQAPEGFYSLTPAHLNPNSKYYLAINTGYPNRYDQANGRTGTHLMIHGACSSAGCYSMTDAQILEIYAFARDAFKGGQQAIQLQAFPFRMTADNMARHRLNPHYDFWKMLKVGYDNFEVTKRPPDVNVCDRQYVFNQQAEEGAKFNPVAGCPQMSTPPALASALASYQVSYARDYERALRKYDGKVWVDPTEAERKALVADQRRGRDLAYAPTGSALKAGRLMRIEELERMAAASAAPPVSTSSPAAPAPTQAPAESLQSSNGTSANVPVPLQNPADETAQTTAPKKPLWKFWAN